MSADSIVLAGTKLSNIQREAAEWSTGALLLLAGPGSGKTRVLTYRIAKLLSSTPNENFRILALTFTNNAADVMRRRVDELIPGQDHRFFIGTFHSFCADILRQQGMYIGVKPDFNIYSHETDIIDTFNEAIYSLREKTDWTDEILRKTLPIIRNLKSRLIMPEDCGRYIKDSNLGEKISLIYPAYEEQLNKHNALDFDSLILKVFLLFKKYPTFVNFYQTVYPYICIDEFHDTNYAQYNLLRCLASSGYDNIMAVADDDQIIYQWNGASHKRINEFLKDYAATVLQLPVNYRCPPEIVDLANNLIKHNFYRTPEKKPLEAVRPRGVKDVVRLLNDFADSDEEMSAIAEDIVTRHCQEFNTLVVLARNRRMLLDAQKALEAKGVSAIISQRRDEFRSIPFIWLHSILKLANDRKNGKLLEVVCGTFQQIANIETDSEIISTEADASNGDYLRGWITTVKLLSVNFDEDQIIVAVLRNLELNKDYRTFSENAIQWFEKLVKENPVSLSDPSLEIFEGYTDDKEAWYQLMREITDSLGDDVTLEAFLQELEMRSKEPPPKTNTVTLMTIHASKGTEFNHVYLVGAVDDELPSFQSKQKGSASLEMEEERRNCFVAITRTIETLTISYAKKYRGWDKNPSRFLYEMGILNNK